MCIYYRTQTRTFSSMTLKHTGGAPSAEDPIEEIGDELHINIANTHIPSKGENPLIRENPVNIFNASDFDINRSGELYINYTTGPFVYGRINDEHVFVPIDKERGVNEIRIEIDKGFMVHNDARSQKGLVTNIHGIRSVNIKPTKIIKNKGIFETEPSFYLPLDKLYTMDQIKQVMTQAKYSDFSIKASSKNAGHVTLKRALNMGLYVIYHRNTGKMYTSYEFVKAVFTNSKDKTHGYLVFKKSEPMRARELKELAPFVEELKDRPYDNPASIVGQNYRSAKERFDKATGQAFSEEEPYKQVMSELKSNMREKSKTMTNRGRGDTKGGRTKKNHVEHFMKRQIDILKMNKDKRPKVT